MKASLAFRIAAILIALFAAGHTFGFSQINPAWKIDPLIHDMRTIRFQAQGMDRTYWDFYFGFGLFVTLLLLFAAATTWQLGSLPAATLVQLRPLAATLTLTFAAVAYLSWRYFFAIPIAFSVVIFAVLVTGTLLIKSPSS